MEVQHRDPDADGDLAEEALPSFGIGGFTPDAVVYRASGVVPPAHARGEIGSKHAFFA